MATAEKYTYTRSLPATDFVERHLVTLLIKELKKKGWKVLNFDDECDTVTPVCNAVEAWGAFNQYGRGLLTFRKGKREGWVLLVGGNGEDVISDWLTVLPDEAMKRVFLY